MTARRVVGAAAVGVAAMSLVAACGDRSATDAGGSSSARGAVTGDITVFAAASLTEPFTALGKRFEQQYPGSTVTFSFGPSSSLAEQIAQGAPADVFASASTTTMQQVTGAGDAASPTTFAKNLMEIAAPPSNPAHVTGLADLARGDVKVVLCQSQVPCGTVAAKVFATARLTVRPVSQVADVKAVLAKVELGEADAGVVYVSDVRAAGSKVRGIPIPAGVNASTDYPIATVKTSKNAATAQEFVDLVLSAPGRSALQSAGFQAP